MKAYNVRVYGRVQRVGFRRFVQELGQELGLAGYVKNERDGSVTVFLQGEDEAVAKFIETIKTPPPPASVRNVEAEETKPKPRLKYFEIRYGRLADELQEGFGAMQTIFLDYWSEFRDYRSEFRDYWNEFREYRSEFREFVKRMNEFSERVTRVLELLTEESAKSREMLEIVVRDSRETREMLVKTMRTLKEIASKLA
ncbi:MAG: acylphosphatase [Candidatus Caldarchaeum sp.]